MIADFIREEELIKELLKLTKDRVLNWSAGNKTFVASHKGSTVILMVGSWYKAIQIYDEETDFCIGTKEFQDLLVELHNTIIKA